MKNTARKFLILSLTFCALSVEFAAQTCVSTPSGLVAWYRAEGNANDASGNGYHGALQSGTTFSAGKVGQAFNFSNLPGVVVADNLVFNPQNFTIELWATAAIYVCSTPGFCQAFLVAKSGSTGFFGYDIGVRENGTLRFSLNGATGGADVIGNQNIADGNFHHVVGTYDGATMKIFVDGVLDAQASVVATINYEANSPFHIGSRQYPIASSNAPYPGKIDEASLYNRALSASEIQAVFNAGSMGKCFIPTAASVSISGRVTTAVGRGIGKARVSLTDSNGETRAVFTNSFGYYRFPDVPAGETYIFSVSHKRYEFAPQVLHLNEERSDVDFLASN